PLLEAADPQGIGRRIVGVRARAHRRPAVGAKRVPTLCAALCGLDVDLRLPGEQAERRLRRVSRNPKGGSGKHLSIGAVADVHAVRIDLGFVSDMTAVARTLNSHGGPPQKSTNPKSQIANTKS